MIRTILLRAVIGAVGAVVLASEPARADIVLSQLIVELQTGAHAREDVEVWNNSPDRSFVAVEPREVVDPSLPAEHVRTDPDPEKLGLLVSPARMILEPGQRRILRLASLSKDGAHEHVYRVTVKPVSGPIQSDQSGLRIMVGYDVLVLVRPTKPSPDVKAIRNGRTLTFINNGNVSVEVVEGRQCRGPKGQCTELPGKRVYPGAQWSTTLPGDGPANYALKSPGRVDHVSY